MKFRFGVAHTEQEMSTMIQTSVFYVDNTGPVTYLLIILALFMLLLLSN